MQKEDISTIEHARVDTIRILRIFENFPNFTTLFVLSQLIRTLLYINSKKSINSLQLEMVHDFHLESIAHFLCIFLSMGIIMTSVLR